MNHASTGSHPPMKARVLVSWLGRDDIAELGRERGGEDEALARAETGWKDLVANSRIKDALKDQEFDTVHLFSNFSPQMNCIFEEWLGKPVTIQSVKVDAFDFGEVFTATDKLLSQIVDLHPPETSDLHIHLSSGTSTMIAVMLLLGSTRYQATLCQTVDGKMSTTALPFKLDLIVREQFEKPDLAWERAMMGTTPGERSFKAIIGDCVELRQPLFKASRVAVRNINVLLLGESGVGKELFAAAIHKASGRKGNCVEVNCGAIPSELFEAELFGTIEGSGSGVAARDGYFKAADGGTLFLDEVGELLPQHQSKLLRALQSSEDAQSPTKRKLQTVGASGKQYEVDVRIIAATNRDLLATSTQSSFRNDLYYRLSTFFIRIPPLREHLSDVPAIAKHLLTRINEQCSATDPGFTPKSLSDAAYRRLSNYHWPGNVRELRAVLDRAVTMATGTRLEVNDIDQVIVETPSADVGTPFSRTRGPGFALDARLDLIQKVFIEDALAEVEWNQRKAADLLGINYQTLNKRVHSLKIKTDKTTA